MGFRTVIFALNLLNLLLLFRFLLGCEFRKTRGSVIMGIVILACVYLSYVPEIGDFLFQYVDFGSVLWALLPVACLKGRKVNLFCIGCVLFSFLGVIYDLVIGIILVILGEKTNFSFFNLYSMSSLAVAALIFIVLSYCTRNFRNAINEVVNIVNPLVYVFSLIVVHFCRWEWTYLGSNMNLNDQMIYQGWNKVNNAIVAMVSIVLIIALVSIYYQRKQLRREIRLKEKCIKEQAEQYDFMGKANQESRKFRHDFNKHMDVLSNLFDKGQTEELGEYIHQLSDIKERACYISTGNMVCDAIVNQYYVKCREEGIVLKCSGAFPEGMSIEVTDICILMSNALENAYEAARQCVDSREIQCRIGNRKHLIFITIQNSAANPPMIEEGAIQTTKADRERHGFGTKNMQESALRNGGSVRWRYDAAKHIVETKICLKDRNL